MSAFLHIIKSYLSYLIRRLPECKNELASDSEGYFTLPHGINKYFIVTEHDSLNRKGDEGSEDRRVKGNSSIQTSQYRERIFDLADNSYLKWPAQPSA